MQTSPIARPHEPRAPSPERLRDLMWRGRPVDALSLVAHLPPIEAWSDLALRRAIAPILDDLGAPKRAARIGLGSYRRAPETTAGRLELVRAMFVYRSAYEAWRTIQEGEVLRDDATPGQRSDLALFEARALTMLRDFEAARAAARRAERGCAAPWMLSLVGAAIALHEDRHAPALALAEEARAMAPGWPDATGLVAHLLVLTGELDRAIDVLREDAAQTQSAALALQLAALLEERKLFDERARWIDAWAERSPLLEEPTRKDAFRADAAYDRGDLAGALAHAKRVPAGFHASVAERLAVAIADPSLRRCVLDVPFVRQHHMTCAPATLSAIARYWGAQAQHLEIADAICYDGTPSHSERTWAEEHGFVVRELTVTWASAKALLARGVPITVATVMSASAHLQAIVGFDERRGTLLIRDPTVPVLLESLAEEWIACWKATGPHGMAIVPAAEAARLDGLAFEDGALYDALHALNGALDRHDRAAAQAACDRLVAEAPQHRLAISARRAVAAYDQDPEKVLACARELSAMFPDFAQANLEALGCMRAIRPRAERLAAAAALAEAHPTEALFAEALATELLTDAREHARAERLLRKPLRARSDRHVALMHLAAIRWQAGAFAPALALYRFAACVGGFDERAASTYFEAARALGREEEGLALLRQRVALHGARGAGPSMSLHAALDQLGRTGEGLSVLDAAIAARPEDGALLLFAADARAAIGELDAAAALVARAAGHAREAQTLRAEAQLALRRGDVEARREKLARLVAGEPLDAQAHADYANALAATQGAHVARAHLASAWAAAPHNRRLARLRIEWLRAEGAKALEAAAREVIAIDASDAWIHRELALALLEQGRIEDARAALDAAGELAPRDASLASIRAHVFRREGRTAEARAALLTAIALDADRTDAIHNAFVGLGAGDERAAVRATIEPLVRGSSVTGAGLEAFFAVAYTSREHGLRAASLERLLAERPGLASSWVCAIRHRTATGDHDGALELADRACARFPLVGAVWSERADALVAAGRASEALPALERAAVLSELDERALANLAEGHLRAGDRGRAREALRRAIGRVPSSVALRLKLAEVEAAGGDVDAAMAAASAAVALAPEDADGWRELDALSDGEAGHRALEAIERLAAERPWSAGASLNVARARGRRDDLAGALAAVERAIAIAPRMFEAHDLRAILLALLGRFDEAERACAPAVLAGDVPRELRGRAAWVRAQRKDLDGAIAALREVLASGEPDYVWGWLELMKWLEARGATTELVEAAKQAAAALPGVAVLHRRLAGAHLALGERRAARAALVRAAELAPNDVASPLLAFDLALEDGDAEAARALVPALHAADAAVAFGAEARLAARVGDDEGALQAMRALATSPKVSDEAVAWTRRILVVEGYGARVDALFGELLEEPKASAAVGALWARTRSVHRDLPELARRMATVDPTTRAAVGAARAWLAILAEAKDANGRREAARILRARFARADDPLWTDIGGALVGSGATDEAVRWLSDWRERPHATSAMLLNVASSLREQGDDRAAFEVVQKAAGLPEDGATRSHRTWLAFELAMRGQHVEARRTLALAGDLTGVPVLGPVGKATEAALAAHDRSVGGALQASKLLKTARDQAEYAVVIRAHGRAVKRVEGDLPGALALLFRYRESFVMFGWVALASVLIVAFVGTAIANGSKFPVGAIPGAIIAIRVAISNQQRKNAQ